jgi:hypothetical protein
VQDVRHLGVAVRADFTPLGGSYLQPPQGSVRTNPFFADGCQDVSMSSRTLCPPVVSGVRSVVCAMVVSFRLAASIACKSSSRPNVEMPGRVTPSSAVSLGCEPIVCVAQFDNRRADSRARRGIYRLR